MIQSCFYQHMNKFYLIFILIMSFISCQQTESEKTVTIQDKYSLTIPSFLTKVTNLNKQASLQYQHASKGLYIIGWYELKKTFQKNLKKNQYGQYLLKLTAEKKFPQK